MKKSFRILLILALVCVCHMAAAEKAGVSIDEIHFPDEAFRSVVAGYDPDGDGLLSGEEAARAVSVDVRGKNVKTLQGIEYLTGLEKLDCTGNGLTQLDLSGNRFIRYLYCSGNQLEKLDISSCLELANAVRMNKPAEENGILKWETREIFLTINRTELQTDRGVNLYTGEAVAEETESASWIKGNMPVYYNPEGGRHYHLDPHCLSFDVPLKDCFLYAERDREPYCELLPCECCVVPMERTEETPYTSLGDVIKDPVSSFCVRTYYLATAEREGRYYRVMTRMDGKGTELFEEMFAESRSGNAENGQKENEYYDYIKTLPVSYEEEITEAPVSQEELEALAGKTLGEVFAQGFELKDYYSGKTQGAYFVMDKGMYEYLFSVNITSEEYKEYAARNDFNDLTAESAELSGLSGMARDIRVRPDGTRIVTD